MASVIRPSSLTCPRSVSARVVAAVTFTAPTANDIFAGAVVGLAGSVVGTVCASAVVAHKTHDMKMRGRNDIPNEISVVIGLWNLSSKRLPNMLESMKL